MRLAATNDERVAAAANDESSGSSSGKQLEQQKQTSNESGGDGDGGMIGQCGGGDGSERCGLRAAVVTIYERRRQTQPHWQATRPAAAIKQ